MSDTTKQVEVAVVVAAYNEADRIGQTLAALEGVFPGAPKIVADDGSTDDTAATVEAAGAHVVSTGSCIGKGGAMSVAVSYLLAGWQPKVVLLCDGDLGGSAEQLDELVKPVSSGKTDLAIATFKTSVGGGFGLTVGSARWLVKRSTSRTLTAPISGQRALTLPALQASLPFAAGYGMEVGMDISVIKAGFRVAEVPLELKHRATGKSLSGFIHRGRQLAHILKAYRQRA